MDYTRTSTVFKIRKALRYLQLYGVQRTLIKVRGQIHMRKKYATLPDQRERVSARHVGLIGCGNFCFTTIAYFLRRNRGAVIRAAMDVDINKAASIYQAYGLDYYTDDARRIVDDEKIDLVYIASNHASHAEYAIACLNKGKSVYIEKPHAVSLGQLERLCDAIAASNGKALLGFNRPHSPFGRALREALAGQTGPTMLNWFVVGHAIPPGHWYFDPQEGGRVPGNLCHWIDFIYHCIDADQRYPITITPAPGSNTSSDIAVTYTFGDKSMAAITFSAKGYTFEGVRERLGAHRGDVIAYLEDFHKLTIETGAQKKRLHSRFREHGHERAILSVYDAVRSPASAQPTSNLSYIWETGELFLKTKLALEEDRQVTVEAYTPGAN